MILADSLQILENEEVQSAIISARVYGILIGMAIMTLILFGVLLALKNQLKSVEKSNTISKYLRLRVEENLLEMIDICKECIEGDVRIAKPVVNLLNEFPGYDEERKAKEMDLFPEITSRYKDIIDDRSSVAETIKSIVEKDITDIRKEMAVIEQQYPEETAKYNKEPGK